MTSVDAARPGKMRSTIHSSSVREPSADISRKTSRSIGETLTFDRTVDRSLVRLSGIEEVFLTDFRSMPDGRFLGAARLPMAHPYYTDHLVYPRSHDPLIVFESVRQALLCAMTLHHRVSADLKTIPIASEMKLIDQQILCSGDRDLEMVGTTATSEWCEGTLARVVHEVTVYMRGCEAARVTVNTALQSADSYEKLRMKYRTSPPPSSNDFISDDRPVAMSPYLVGRECAKNVLLRQVSVVGRSLTAKMRLPVSNSSMFDHAHDHIPGQVLIEAARQAAILLAGEAYGRSSSKVILDGFSADYERFAELDSEVVLRAYYPHSLEPGTFDDPIYVDFTQDSSSVATMQLQLAGTQGRWLDSAEIFYG